MAHEPFALEEFVEVDLVPVGHVGAGLGPRVAADSRGVVVGLVEAAAKQPAKCQPTHSLVHRAVSERECEREQASRSPMTPVS